MEPGGGGKAGSPPVAHTPDQGRFQVENGSVLLQGEQFHEGLRCRFQGSNGQQRAGAEEGSMPQCTRVDGRVMCCPGQTLSEEDRNAQVLMEVLDGKNCVASHLFPGGAFAHSQPSTDLESSNWSDQKGWKDGGKQPAVALDIGADDKKRQEELLAAQETPYGEDPYDPNDPKTWEEKYSALKPFIIISSSYLLFTITDGALRMIILLHAYELGFSAMEVAIMFLAYEVAGVVTNLAAGVMGARWGIRTTLLTGLSLQIIGIGILMAWQDSWSEEANGKWKGIVFATMTQITIGVAKDLTKLGGKTVTKLVTPDEKQSQLFKLVSLITGWKNSLKGVGYFVGSAAVTFNYYFALGLMIFIILLAMPWAWVGLSDKLGRTRKENLNLRTIFIQNYNINILSLSRFFLFASRDLWFEVPLPFFLRDSEFGLGWSRYFVGVVMAVFIIIYGQIQSWSPHLVLKPLRQYPANKWINFFWCSMLAMAPIYLGIVIQSSGYYEGRESGKMIATLITGLVLFAFLFGINSCVHSYLIVRYAEGDKVAMNVGFYYMANAMGRLVGTIMSGALYTYAGDNVLQGFAACFWASLAFVVMSALIDLFASDNVGGLKLTRFITLVPAPTGPDPNRYGMKREEKGKDVEGEAA